MTTRLSDSEIVECNEMLEKELSKIAGHRGDRIRDMMAGPVGLSFGAAPASSREEFHSCYPGGLLVHSLRVLDNLRKLDVALGCEFNDESMIIAGLFHDLGKAGDGENEFYVPQTSDWHRNKGMLYETNKKCVQMPTSERGLFILQKFGVELTPDEYLAIRLNDGQYDDTNKWYRMREPTLAIVTHFADRWAAEEEKQ